MVKYDKTVATNYARLRRLHPTLLETLISDGRVGLESCVLELGCGTGNYITAICERTSCAGCGVDPSAAMLAEAKSQSIRWIHAAAEETSLGDSQFDLIFGVDLVHHLDDRRRAFGEALRLLRRTGMFCLATDSEDIIRNRRPLSIYWPETIETELARYPKIATLESELQQAGFVDLNRKELEFEESIVDPTPYRAKVFSALRTIPDQSYQRGLARLETDLAMGPVLCRSRYLLLSAYKIPVPPWDAKDTKVIRN